MQRGLRLTMTMATALHQVALRPAAAVLSVSRQQQLSLRPSPPSASLASSALSQPWWRQLALALPQSAARAAAPRPLQGRSFAVRASAAEAEAVDVEAEVAEPVKTKALTKQVKHIMNILNEEAAKTLKAERNLPNLRPGDVVAMKVEVPENKRRVSLVRGIVIARHNAGINSTFRIRRVMAGVGVEMVFPLYSPNIKEIKVVDKRKARRAKLYYLRDKIARLSTVN